MLYNEHAMRGRVATNNKKCVLHIVWAFFAGALVVITVKGYPSTPTFFLEPDMISDQPFPIAF